MAAVKRPVGAAPSPLVRWIVLGIVGALFAIPILAMIEFTLRGAVAGTYDLGHWAAVLDPEKERAYRVLFQGLGNSLVLAAATVVIVLVFLVPAMVIVAVGAPRLRRALEFVCIIPITVPAIVLVVGLAPVYSVVVRVFGSAPWTLAFAYGITVLPYAYRAIQSNLAGVDVVTLSEAARSLGASWGSVFFRVIVPNIRRGILVASIITVAVVLGEYTIASLLNRNTLQTALVQVSKSDPYVAVIFALLALALVFVLLLVIGRVSTAGRRGRRARGGRALRPARVVGAAVAAPAPVSEPARAPAAAPAAGPAPTPGLGPASSAAPTAAGPSGLAASSSPVRPSEGSAP
ncbi:ABC transporter permease subunit [Cnuibacter physcomitrellae]|uniref:ABC transporter permease n=1 Tax=Cnuibacter physcomitrellae TaxID=1619308 RepID=UPI00217589E5|nr:ABC transporter permease subunit [Cnuibacter physcomitrellae]MCS5497633.1 ABC transporter permease subunit [Cnuibacter physcomitrellae]